VVLEVDLQQAVQKGELQVIYQPILSLSSGQLTGFEALVQWYHPVYGLLPAAEFIPLAQESGLIFPIDWWVFEEACRQAQEWQTRYHFDPPLQIQVNLTSSLMARPDLLGRIRQILNKTGLERRTLKLEISESMVSAAQDQVARIIHAVGEMGVGVQIDNFGVGAASLLNLKHFPVSGLKIDHQYIHEIDDGAHGELIVRTIVTLAHQLELPTTAQGVESVAQLQALRRMGCDFGQGFLFSSLLIPEEIAALLEKRQRGESLFV
jgi:EAL domain-containing protein (putative c-di-GMP-specific phosphodiesterase class I)